MERSLDAGETTGPGGVFSDGGGSDGGNRGDCGFFDQADGVIGDGGGTGTADGGNGSVPVGVAPCTGGATPARMPRAYYDIGVTSGLDGRLYLLNMGQANNKSIAYAYDVSSSVWTRLPDVPKALNGSSSPVRIGNQIYAVSNHLYAYDAASSQWTAKTSLVPERVGMVATRGTDGKVYASGGVLLGSQAGTAHSYLYDPVSDAWSNLAERPQLDGFAGTATGADGKVYVAGQHAVVLDPSTRSWTTLSDPPTPRIGSSLVSVSGKLYEIGGREPGLLQPSSAVEMYDAGSDAWTARAPMPVAANRASASLACDGKVYVFGGVDPMGHQLDLVQVYDPVANSWQTSP